MDILLLHIAESPLVKTAMIYHISSTIGKRKGERPFNIRSGTIDWYAFDRSYGWTNIHTHARARRDSINRFSSLECSICKAVHLTGVLLFEEIKIARFAYWLSSDRMLDESNSISVQRRRRVHLLELCGATAVCLHFAEINIRRPKGWMRRRRERPSRRSNTLGWLENGRRTMCYVHRKVILIYCFAVSPFFSSILLIIEGGGEEKSLIWKRRRRRLRVASEMIGFAWILRVQPCARS